MKNYFLFFFSRIYIRKKKIKGEEKMQDKGLDFKHKEVVNINNGKRLGYVQDVCADLETGTITSIIVPGSNKVLNLFSQNNEIVIPWQNIKCIGDDLILVEI
jgi:YlmC/YmxH family sporulation protein